MTENSALNYTRLSTMQSIKYIITCNETQDKAANYQGEQLQLKLTSTECFCRVI